MKNPLKILIHIAASLLAWVAPRSCAGCGKNDEIFCKTCAQISYRYGAACAVCRFRNPRGLMCLLCRKNENIMALSHVLWAGTYKNELRSAIHSFKYRKRTELAGPLGGLLAQKFKEIFPTWTSDVQVGVKPSFVAIPIPLYAKKEHSRRFNQAQLLAEEFSRRTGIVRYDCLEKIKDTPAQVETKNKAERLGNLENAFRLRDPNRVWVNTRIILIDDVATTAATLEHAARVLKDAGFKKVIGLVVAHG